MNYPNFIGFKLFVFLFFLFIPEVFTERLAAQTRLADSLITAISHLPARDQVTQLLEYSKSFQYTNPAMSLQLAKHAHKTAKKTDDPLFISNALNALAIMNFYSGNNREAAQYIIQSITCVKKACREFPDSIYLTKRLVAMYNNAGNIYQAMGEMDKALETLLSSLKLSDTLIAAEPKNASNIPTRIKILNNTAVVYQSLNEPEKADQLLLKALNLGRDLDDPRALLPTLNNLGLIRIDQERYNEAIEYYMEALELGHQVSDSMGISGNYNNLGLIYEKLGNKRKALSYYLASLDITQRLGFSIGIANTCANAGRLYSEINIPDSAVYYVKKGIDDAIKSGNNTYLMKNYQTLSSIYEKTGALGKALDMHKKFMGVKDSIFDTEKNKQIEEMTARFETEKKEKENQLLRKNIEIQQRTTLLLIISLVAIILIALLLYYFYRLKNKALKQQSKLNEKEQDLYLLETARLEDQLFAEHEINRLQNEKLQQKNRELSTRMLHNINKNDAMMSIMQQIQKVREDDRQDSGASYDRIMKIAKENLSLDKDWDQFKLHFEEVNPGFFYNLTQKFPTLTQNEQKLCAYYRINLGTKEIARILNITPAAVQKSRYRLRKKMHIASDIALYDFMAEL